MTDENDSGVPDMAASDTPLMLPLMVNVTGLSIMLVGGGELPARLAMLEKHGARKIHVFAPSASDELKKLAGTRLMDRWPEPDDYARLNPKLVFVAEVDEERAANIQSHAKRAGALVHVQDCIPLCDFHLPALVRRGHLQVTVSTDGTVAGLSRIIREYLEKDVFGPEWAARVDELAAARRKWKMEGLSFEALSRAIREFVASRGWLKRT
jgi:precorrin-2 dehydrogenase / sirohydrochlorin ferrochelatase